MAGSIPGSDYYLVGGITELNFNIRSVGANGDGGQTTTVGVKGSASASLYVMNVGMDLRLVDTNTLQVVDVISYQKQIIGHQIQAGVFDFLGQTFFDVSAGESALEPVQLAVRSVIEAGGAGNHLTALSHPRQCVRVEPGYRKRSARRRHRSPPRARQRAPQRDCNERGKQQ